MNHTVRFEPSGSVIEIAPGKTLLEAARELGIPLAATCGGRGTCGKCRVRILDGVPSESGQKERASLSESDLAQGWRLACQQVVSGPIIAEAFLVRPSSKGDSPLPYRPNVLSPPVRRQSVEPTPPSLEQAEDDASRLCAALEREGAPAVTGIDYEVARKLPDVLRNAGWKVTASLRGGELIGLRPQSATHSQPSSHPHQEPPALGLALDLGTTNLAAYLHRLDDGGLLGVYSAQNPLASYGADIISRLAYSSESAEHENELKHVLAKAVNLLAAHAAHENGCTPEDIEELVVVGNSGMHHLFLGLSGRYLTRAPFVPAMAAPLSVKARDLGIAIGGGGSYVHLPPLVGGFVGSDLLAVALATRLDKKDGIRLAMDIGTNTELLLSVNGKLHCCSTASGPALEGAALKFGTMAAPGAIDSMWLAGVPGRSDAALTYSSLENKPVTGICGSGIIDALACLLKSGAVNHTGRLQAGFAGVIPAEDGDHRYVLAREEDTALGQDLTISQMEIRALQLAKGAIRAGIDTLLSLHGLAAENLDEILIAGTFGNHLHIESTLAIGLLPSIPLDRIRQIGNAAGTGASLMLLSLDERRSAAALARKITHVELSLQDGFRTRFARSQWFPQEQK